MARQEATSRKNDKPKPPPPSLALTIPEFAEAARISVGMYFKMKKQGFGPREAKIGTRTVITIAAANEWLESREQA